MLLRTFPNPAVSGFIDKFIAHSRNVNNNYLCTVAKALNAPIAVEVDKGSSTKPDKKREILKNLESAKVLSGVFDYYSKTILLDGKPDEFGEVKTRAKRKWILEKVKQQLHNNNLFCKDGFLVLVGELACAPTIWIGSFTNNNNKPEVSFLLVEEELSQLLREEYFIYLEYAYLEEILRKRKEAEIRAMS